MIVQELSKLSHQKRNTINISYDSLARKEIVETLLATSSQPNF